MKPKRQLLGALLLAVQLPAISAGFGSATGKNALGETVRIDGDWGEVLLVYAKNKPEGPVATFDMRLECPAFADSARAENDKFTCPAGRASPLSGVTYKVTKSKRWRPCDIAPFHDKGPGVVYVCTSGCDNPRVPKTLRHEPWEC